MGTNIGLTYCFQESLYIAEIWFRRSSKCKKNGVLCWKIYCVSYVFMKYGCFKK